MLVRHNVNNNVNFVDSVKLERTEIVSTKRRGVLAAWPVVIVTELILCSVVALSGAQNGALL